MTTLRFADDGGSLAAAVRQGIAAGESAFTIDLEGLAYADPAALRALGAAADAARTAGATLRFAHARVAVYKALHVAHLV